MGRTKETFNHADYCHCSDWDKKKCPAKCFRARLTKDLKENGYEYPVPFTNFKNTEHCLLENDLNATKG